MTLEKNRIATLFINNAVDNLKRASYIYKNDALTDKTEADDIIRGTRSVLYRLLKERGVEKCGLHAGKDKTLENVQLELNFDEDDKDGVSN